MKIGVVTHGTRGDTQPFIALGQRLKAQGHEMAICCPASDVAMVQEYGLPVFGLTFDAKKMVKGDTMQKAMDSGDGNKCVEAFVQSVAEQKASGANSPEEASEFIDTYKPDIILAHISFQNFHVLAEKHGVPVMNMMFMPWLPSRHVFPAFKTREQLEADGVSDPLEAHRQLFEAFVSDKDLAETNELRQRWGLRPHTMAEMHSLLQCIPTANCWSSAVIPEPEDLTAEFPLSRQTGYLFADPPRNYVPAAKLQEFLEAPGQERPVYIGFGSLAAGSPRLVTEKVLRALMLAGKKRCVMAGGWSGIGPEHLDPQLTEDYATLKGFADTHVCKVDAVPHTWLLPQCCAAVHHGGAGTTGATVYAGVPTAIAPFAWDQPWWAEQLEDMGVGIKLSGMITQIDAEELGTAIKRLTEDSGMSELAASLGVQVRSEDGAGRLEEFIKSTISAPFFWPTPAQPQPSTLPLPLWGRPHGKHIQSQKANATVGGA